MSIIFILRYFSLIILFLVFHYISKGNLFFFIAQFLSQDFILIKGNR
jgi:hypothetical protein